MAGIVQAMVAKRPALRASDIHGESPDCSFLRQVLRHFSSSARQALCELLPLEMQYEYLFWQSVSQSLNFGTALPGARRTTLNSRIFDLIGPPEGVIAPMEHELGKVIRAKSRPQQDGIEQLHLASAHQLVALSQPCSPPMLPGEAKDPEVGVAGAYRDAIGKAELEGVLAVDGQGQRRADARNLDEIVAQHAVEPGASP